MVLRNGKERLVLGRGSCPDILCLHSQPSIVTACSCFCLPGLCQCCSGSVLFPCAFPLKTAPCQEGWTFSDGLCWPWAWQLVLAMHSPSALIQRFRHVTDHECVHQPPPSHFRLWLGAVIEPSSGSVSAWLEVGGFCSHLFVFIFKENVLLRYCGIIGVQLSTHI